MPFYSLLDMIIQSFGILDRRTYFVKNNLLLAVGLSSSLGDPTWNIKFVLYTHYLRGLIRWYLDILETYSICPPRTD